MNPTSIPEPFDQLDALERNIEDGTIPSAGGLIFEDPLGRMLDKLEQDIETGAGSQPTLNQVANAPDDLSQNDLPLQPQGQDTHYQQDVSVLPAMPYYTEASQRPLPFHAPPHLPTGRVGRLGGTSMRSSHTAQSGQRYCPIKRGFVSVENCEDCEYYDEEEDLETGSYCTYYSQEES